MQMHEDGAFKTSVEPGSAQFRAGVGPQGVLGNYKACKLGIASERTGMFATTQLKPGQP